MMTKNYAVVGYYEFDTKEKYIMGYYDTMTQAKIAIEDFSDDVEIDIEKYQIVNGESAKKYDFFF